MNLLEIENLESVCFNIEKKDYEWLLRECSFTLGEGCSIAITGESGSGKSTLAAGLMGFNRAWPGVVDGEMRWNEKPIIARLPEVRRDGVRDVSKFIQTERYRFWRKLRESSLKKLRGKGMFLVSQEPRESLTPYLKVRDQVNENKAIPQEVSEILSLVGLEKNVAFQYPHELSTGMAQRVILAIAIALNPRLIIADEPTDKLDLWTCRKVINFFKYLRFKMNIALILLTHQLSLIAELADQVIILFGGWIVEKGSSGIITGQGAHPYTRSLVEAGRLSITSLSPPAKAGCPYIFRCATAKSMCSENTPPLCMVEEGHWVRCFL